MATPLPVLASEAMRRHNQFGQDSVLFRQENDTILLLQITSGPAQMIPPMFMCMHDFLDLYQKTTGGGIIKKKI